VPDVIDASVALSARRWDATVVTTDRSDVQGLDPAARIVEW